MSFTSKLMCAVFGHRWLVDSGAASRIFGPGTCQRCGATHAGYQPPPMPECKPSRADAVSIQVKVELDGMEEAEARTAKLHAQWSEIGSMVAAAGMPPATGGYVPPGPDYVVGGQPAEAKVS